MGSEIILELTTNYPAFTKRIIKFHQIFNRVFSEKANSEMFIEPIENGMILFFRDFEALKLIHKPIPKVPEFIKKRIFRIEPDEAREILGPLLESAETYPKQGIIYYLRSKTNKIEDFFSIMRKYYASIHPRIITTLEQDYLAIHFQTFEAARSNFDLAIYAVYKLLREEGITIHDVYKVENEDIEKT